MGQLKSGDAVKLTTITYESAMQLLARVDEFIAGVEKWDTGGEESAKLDPVLSSADLADSAAILKKVDGNSVARPQVLYR
jgi:hypothetical protein